MSAEFVPDIYLRPGEAARLVDLTPAKLRWLVAMGRGPDVARLDGPMRFLVRKDRLLDWAREHGWHGEAAD